MRYEHFGVFIICGGFWVRPLGTIFCWKTHQQKATLPCFVYIYTYIHIYIYINIWSFAVYLARLEDLLGILYVASQSDWCKPNAAYPNSPKSKDDRKNVHILVTFFGVGKGAGVAPCGPTAAAPPCGPTPQPCPPKNVTNMCGNLLKSIMLWLIGEFR